MTARAAVLLMLLLAGCAARPPQSGVPPPTQAPLASPTLTLAAAAPAAEPPGGSPLATPTPLPASTTPRPTGTPAPPTLTPAPASPTPEPSQTIPAAIATPAEPASGPTLPAAEPTAAPPSPVALAEPALQLLELTNQLRSAEGCPALQLEPRLVDAAQRHAQDLADHVLISHEGSDGATLRERLDRVGYPYQFAGENIAAGYQSAELVMEMWTTGDEFPDGPHRKNILDCRYTTAGVGLAYGSNYGSDHYPYWVLDLASSRQ